jgi:glycosyltransferase involved in cell wall biosynthesis
VRDEFAEYLIIFDNFNQIFGYFFCRFVPPKRRLECCMPVYPVFLSVVYVVRNQAGDLAELLKFASAQLSELASDHELIVVDNASTDESIAVLKTLTGQEGLPNMQVYALIKQVDSDTASWVGIENALGDFVAVIDPQTDDLLQLPSMLEKAVNGADVVFANNQIKPRQSLAYRIAQETFNLLYKTFNGVHLAKEAPHYRLLSKRVVNFILQHPQPALTYRHLPATSGFARATIDYRAKLSNLSTKRRLGDNIDRGVRLIVSTTQVPMRLVTALSLFGAAVNVVYSVYVLAIAFFKTNVAPGWVSLSLQQSGMFFLLSLVLLVLGEYILHMANLSNEGPLYHVGQEFTSVRMLRLQKLNIEVVSTGRPAEAGVPSNSGEG